jgi:hypothetical protein
MLFGIEFSQRLHQQLVNVRVVLLFLQVAVDSRGSHTCALVTTLCLGSKAIVKRNPASTGYQRSHSALDRIAKFRQKLDKKSREID